MKKFLALITLFIPLLAASQITQYTAFRIWAIDSFRLGPTWLRKITTNLNTVDSNSHNMVPTNRAVMDMIRTGGGGVGNLIDGHPVTKNFTAFGINKWQKNHIPKFDIIDSTFYPGFPDRNKLSIPVGETTYIFGNSIISPSVTPPTDSMHGTVVARTIGGTLLNYAVGGTDIRNGLARLTQEWLLPRGSSSLAWWQHGIDRRDDISDGADSAVVYGARVAGCMAFRDTTVATSNFILTGTWSDFTGGLTAGGMSEGKVTSTAGDWFQFQITGRFAFFTFFSENINNNPTNYSDSITVTIDGTYYGSYSTRNVGMYGNKYMGAIIIHNLTNAAHNIRVINQRNLPLAIDFAGALKEPANARPVLFELVPPVGDSYIAGTGFIKKKVFNRMNYRYSSDIWNQWQRWGFRAFAADPTDGLDMNQHSSDALHPNNEGQRLMAQSLLRQLNIYPVNDPANQWSITGNSGTNPSTNFLGTTDNNDVVIKANGTTRARYYTNNNVGLMQYQNIVSGASNSLLAGAGTLGANSLFGVSLCRAYIDAQDALAAGSPDCRANAFASFAQGDSRTEQSAPRSISLIRGKTFGENTGAIGYGAIANAYMEIVVGPYNDSTGSYLHSRNSWVATDPQFTVSAGDTAGGGSVTRNTIFNLLKNGKARLWKYGLGNFTGTPAFNLQVDANGNLIEGAVSSGITSINSQTGPAITLATGTTGNDFNIAQASNTVTFHLPDASATARGAVSTTTQTFAGAKTFTEQLTVNATTHAAKLRLQGNINSNTEVGVGGVSLQADGITFNDGGAARTVSNANRFHFIGQPTVTATNAVTYSNYTATFGIVGAPLAGVNMTLNTPYALHANDVSYMEGVAMGVNEQSSAITLADPTINIYNGTADTWTLPDLAANPGKVYYIKNAGSGNLTIQRAGSDNIYTSSSVTSFTIAAGSSNKIVGGTSFWYVFN